MGRLNYDQIFLYKNIVNTRKQNKKITGALNIRESPGYNQKENFKKMLINKSKPKNYMNMNV